MLGEFSFVNPTRLHFGKQSLEKLHTELPAFGERVLLVYGGGSIKRTGLYDQVVRILKEHGKTIVEDAGVMPNPTTDKLLEGRERAREGKVDFILAVGGGSVIDYAKALSVSVHCQHDPWETYFERMEAVNNAIIPVGAILTMVGTGSEMNGGSVITNPAKKLKLGRVFGAEAFPKFAILNPEYTYTLPRYQMVAGFFDIMCHILEQYLSGEDDNTSDYIMEGMLRSLIHSSRIAIENPQDYEARSNIMWTATWALNRFVHMGKRGDWMVHKLGQAVGAYTDATHGMTLAAVSFAYYKHILEAGLPKFVRYAKTVWDVNPIGKEDKEVAMEGFARMEEYMKELGLVMSLRELGVTEDMIDGIAQSIVGLKGGYKELSRQDIVEILKASM